MIQQNGYCVFGYFYGLIYGDEPYSEPIELYQEIHNEINRDAVLKHMLDLSPALCPLAGDRVDILSGEELDYVGPGRYEDGPFSFLTEFPYYYAKYNLGIPKEYEAYLKEQGVGV